MDIKELTSVEGRAASIAKYNLPDAHQRHGVFFNHARSIRDGIVTEIGDLRSLERRFPTSPHRVVSDAISQYLEELLTIGGKLLIAIREVQDQVAPVNEQAFGDRLRKCSEEAANRLGKMRADRQFQVYALALGAARASDDEPALAIRMAIVDDLVEKVKLALADVDEKQGLLRDTISARQWDRARSAFAERAKDHATREMFFSAAFGLSILWIIVALISVLTRDLASNATYPQILVFVTHNVIALGAASIATRLMLKRWNLERNLRIVYEHRVAALDQYALFDASISADQHAAKDQLRLEIAKILFTDPTTGYREESAAEVSFTPVVNVDRIPRGA